MNSKIIKLRPLISIIILIMLIGVDQLTKYLAYINLQKYVDVPLINKVVSLYYTTNTGISFSMLDTKMILIIVLTAIIIAAVLYALIRTPKTAYYMAFTVVLDIVLAGAIGNFIDRIFRGYVIDFICLDFINFPIFNIADIFVCVGLVVLVILIFAKYKDKDFEYLFTFKKPSETDKNDNNGDI